MKKIIHFVFCITAFACAAPTLRADESVITNEFVKANNEFAFDLYSVLAKQSTNDNIVVSPFSVSTGLFMAYEGARGKTARQMAEVLHFPSESHEVSGAVASLVKGLKPQTNVDECELDIANSLWLQTGYPLVDAYAKILQAEGAANIYQVDLNGWPGPFAPAKAAMARKQINDWVASRTHGSVNEMLSPNLPDGDTRLILISAIHFVGHWLDAFGSEFTTNALFYIAPKKSVMVPTMNMDTCLGYVTNDTCKVLTMPYLDEDFSMVIFLPKDSLSLNQFERTMNLSDMNKLIKTNAAESVRVSLPKFKVTSDVNLKSALITMGMREAFNQVKSDFSGISASDSGPLYIKSVLHKTSIIVNEAGTEVTVATWLGGAVGSDPVPFIVNRPFIFLIRHNPSGTILFMGRVINPLE